MRLELPWKGISVLIRRERPEFSSLYVSTHQEVADYKPERQLSTEAVHAGSLILGFQPPECEKIKIPVFWDAWYTITVVRAE